MRNAPVAVPGADIIVAPGEVLTFDGTGSRASDSPITRYRWSFGDGTGAEGARRQARMVETARAAGMRLLGPNSMGLADLHSGTWMTVNAIYTENGQIPGRTALLSQSGSMMGGLISRARALGLGFSKSVGVGNEADLTIGVDAIVTDRSRRGRGVVGVDRDARDPCDARR